MAEDDYQLVECWLTEAFEVLRNGKSTDAEEIKKELSAVMTKVISAKYRHSKLSVFAGRISDGANTAEEGYYEAHRS